MRFVVIATARLGAMRRFKPLSDAGQQAAFSQWREDESRDARVEFETGGWEALIAWKRPVRPAGMSRVGWKLKLAERIG